jgi:acetyl esterase/lipase
MRLSLLLPLPGLLALAASAAPPPEIELWPAKGMPFPETLRRAEEVVRDRPRAVGKPTLFVYPAQGENTGAAVVILPGGGYGHLAIQHEGHQVGAFLQRHGITGVVLKYRLPGPDLHPQGHLISLADAQEALRWTRRHAAEYGVQTNRVGVLGFSAGGHLAASASTLHAEPIPGLAPDPVPARPDFTGLIYPVVSDEPDCRHGGSFQNLLGKDPPEALRRRFSLEKQVDARTPPAFTAHSVDDPVKVKNSRLYADALRAHGVRVEQVEFATGGHGYGLGRAGHETAAWPERWVGFIRALVGLPKAPATP